MNVGLIGLGIMGGPMALNLLKGGFALTVYDVAPEKCGPATSQGARRATSPAEVARASEVVITMVPDTPQVEVALLGERGVWQGLREGTTVIDMSTISPRATVEMASRLSEKNCEMLDAPVSGGEKGAREATLAIMVGGKEGVFQKCLPIFQALGKSIVYAGPNGFGQKMKLVNQVINSLNIVAMTEGLRLARAAGLDLETTLRAVCGGAASSWMLVNLGPKILQKDFAPGFSIKLQQKDLRLARELIEEVGGDYPGSKLTFDLFTEALERGLGNQGNQGLINIYEGFQ